jgi:hypothetical protein
MSAITDFVFKKNQLQQNAGQNTMDNIFKVAGLGKDIWNTLNTNDLSGKQQGWNQSNMMQKAAIDKDFIRTQNALDQANKAGDRSAAQAAQDHLAELEMTREKYIQQQENYRAELAAGNSKTDKQAKMMSAIQSSFGTAKVRGDWFLPDPNNPNDKIINPATVDQLRSNILKAVAVYKPTQEDIDVINPYIEDLLAGNIVYNNAGKGGGGIPDPNSASGANNKLDIAGQLSIAFSTINQLQKVKGGSLYKGIFEPHTLKLADDAKNNLASIAKQLPGAEANAIATQLSQTGTWDPSRLKQVQARLQAIYEASRKGAGAKQLLK